MTAAEAERICLWRYGPGWTLYDFGPGDLPAIAAPAAMSHGVRRGEVLAGLASFGAGARVPGGSYRQPALDIGCSMAPELVGHGLGRAFVGAVVGFAWRRFQPPRLRLVVPADNRRAIRVYQANGFVAGERFAGMLRGGIRPFLQMVCVTPAA
ncbi:MAG TPA: GNAT family N-acetyltransferase [Rhodospirillaceae bacterium]|nr:GNAT family N-acetyltransferase [Rhodospirillaceae bacterium]